MNSTVATAFTKTREHLQKISDRSFAGHEDLWRVQNAGKFKQALSECLENEEQSVQQRIFSEYFSFGPLDEILNDVDISEILVNGPDSIWIEKQGRLLEYPDRFLSEATFNNSLHRLCEIAHCQSTVEHPATTGQFKEFRLTLIRQELTKSHHHLSLRRHPKNPWTFEKLQAQDWASATEMESLKELVRRKKSFLIIGGTGSGKTSLINALLQSLPENERAVVIEDTPEIDLPNSSCMKMVTRDDPQGLLKKIDQSELLRHALRLRPDRIVLGEIRGAEAKDLLMALASGHEGSFGTLHAMDPRQALIRLEMLIQIGAPQWSLQAIRRLIQLSLDYILVVGKDACGKRKFQGVYKICSLEDHGFLVEKVLRLH